MADLRPPTHADKGAPTMQDGGLRELRCPCWGDPCETEGCGGTPQEWIDGECYEPTVKDAIIENHGKDVYQGWASLITESGVKCKCKTQPFVAVSTTDGSVECISCHGVRKPKGKAKVYSDIIHSLQKLKKSRGGGEGDGHNG